MDFLLECIGFPPGYDREALVETIQREGESVAWRGAHKTDLRLPLQDLLELRLERLPDKDPQDPSTTLWPYYAEPRRLRIATLDIRAVPDSPFDALLTGWVDPPLPDEPAHAPPGAYLLSTYVTDARRLEQRPEPGHVLAISTAGFALDVSWIGPNERASDRSVLERPRGASIAPLGDPSEPGGCNELSVRIRAVKHLRNPLTGALVERLEVDAPDRPLTLFASRWQLEADGLPAPRPGWRIEGTFLFNGRLRGGLPGPKQRAARRFG